MTRHPDFEKIHRDFNEIRNGVHGEYLYRRFVDFYNLDESKPYSSGSQVRLRELALKSRMHMAIKRQFPQIDWDRFITGRRKAGRVRIRAGHPIKLKVKNLGGRRVRIKFGGEI